jgi:hypothetical protein
MLNSELMAVAKKKYNYTNRITATVKPVNLKKVKDLVDNTGESASGIVDQALTEYFERRQADRASKHSY